MLGNGGLLHSKCFDDLSDRPFRVEGQEVENLAPTRLCHSIESIGGCRCSGHACQYIPLWEYVKRYFYLGQKPRFFLREVLDPLLREIKSLNDRIKEYWPRPLLREIESLNEHI